MIFLRLREQMLVIGCILLLSVIKTIETASDPIEELGDFTLYSHGEIGRYSGYKGMLVGMYRVPSDVHVGTWMIKVKPSPYYCAPSRQIHVHMQAGSLPLVNARGEAFPENFLLNRFTSQYHLQVPNDNENHFLNVTHPLPGPWFLIAYYIDEDESIKQEGLTKTCHSLMIVGLQFRFLRRIPEMVLNESDDPIIMKPKQRTALFKFFIPQTVISYAISAYNCSSSSSSSSATAFDEPYLCPIHVDSRRCLTLHQSSVLQFHHLVVFCRNERRYSYIQSL